MPLDKKLPDTLKTIKSFLGRENKPGFYDLAYGASDPNAELTGFQRARGTLYKAIDEATVGRTGSLGRIISAKAMGVDKPIRQEISRVISSSILNQSGLIGETVGMSLSKRMGIFDAFGPLAEETEEYINQQKTPGRRVKAEDVLAGLKDQAEGIDKRFKLMKDSFDQVVRGFEKFDKRVATVEQHNADVVSRTSELIEKKVDQQNTQNKRNIDRLETGFEPLKAQVSEHESILSSIKADVGLLKASIKKNKLASGGTSSGHQFFLDKKRSLTSKALETYGKVKAAQKLGVMGKLGKVFSGIASRAGAFAAAPFAAKIAGVGAVGAGVGGLGYAITRESETKGSSSYDARTLGDTGNLKVLANDRAKFLQEMKNPDVMKAFAGRITTEVGTHSPKAKMAFIEEIFNRASSRNQTLMQALSGSYYPSHQHTPKRINDPGLFDMIKQVQRQGTNVNRFATGNASMMVGFGQGRGRRMKDGTIWAPGQTATFGDPTKKGTERYGVEKFDIPWHKKMKKAGLKEIKTLATQGKKTGTIKTDVTSSKGQLKYKLPLSAGKMKHRGHGRTSEFGYARGRLHAGVDLYSVDEDNKLQVGSSAKVFSPEDGKITRIAKNRGRAGNYIEIQDKNGLKHRFLHTAGETYNNPTTKKAFRVGDSIKKGQLLTHVTGSGTSFGRMASKLGSVNAAMDYFNKKGWGSTNMPHLHYELKTASGRAIDPGQVFPEFSGKNKTALFGGHQKQQIAAPVIYKQPPDFNKLPSKKRSFASAASTMMTSGSVIKNQPKARQTMTASDGMITQPRKDPDDIKPSKVVQKKGKGAILSSRGPKDSTPAEQEKPAPASIADTGNSSIIEAPTYSPESARAEPGDSGYGDYKNCLV